jgi:2-hydroxycyclohexanecarboxyl-CoA dehydrogenase
VVDITDAAAVASAVRAAEDRAPIDLLINNAAVFQMRNFCEQDPEWIDRIVDTNLKGLLQVTRQVAPRMVDRGAGRIINIASVAGTHGIAQQAVYCASKHGVVGFGDALAQELLPHNVLVTTLCPGGIDTPLWRDGDSPYPGDIESTMKVDELADLVEFLLSQTSRTLYKKLVFFPTSEWH